MKHYWQNCNKREQCIILGGILCVVLMLIYFKIWLPLLQTELEQTNVIIEKHKTLYWIKNTHQEVNTQLPVNNNNLLSIMATAINTAEFKAFPYQIQQITNGDVQINFERVAYRIFITWLWNLSQKYRIEIQQLQVTKTNTPGIVSVSLSVHGYM